MLSRPNARGVGIVALLLALGVFGYWGVWLPLHSSGYDFTGPYQAGYAAARILWWALSLAALLASLWLLARGGAITAGSAGRAIPTWAMGLTLFGAAALAQPVTDSLRLGQSTTFLLLGFALVAYGEVEGRPVVAGVGLAIAILDKLFPGLLLVYFLWRGNYRLCIATIATIALLIVATLP